MCFFSMERRKRGDLIAVFNCLLGGHRENVVFSEVYHGKTRGNGDDLEE